MFATRTSDGFGLAMQDFLEQIVQDEMVAAAEGLDEIACVGASLQRDRGQLQASNPSFGAGLQHSDVVA